MSACGLHQSLLQVEGHHVCNFNTEAIIELFCYSVTDLEPGVSYQFRIRAWNLDVEEPSPWSSELTQATVMGESIIPSSTLGPNPASEITPTPSPSSNPLVIVIVSILAVIVFVAIVIVCLVYKLKITRLKQQMRNGDIPSEKIGQNIHPPESCFFVINYQHWTGTSAFRPFLAPRDHWGGLGGQGGGVGGPADPKNDIIAQRPLFALECMALGYNN